MISFVLSVIFSLTNWGFKEKVSGLISEKMGIPPDIITALTVAQKY